MSKVFTEAEVAQHGSESDCWLIIGNDSTGGPKVYDVTKYLNDHPGGPEIMLDLGGKNADEMFEDIGHSSEARTKMKEYLIGTLQVDPNAPKKSTNKTSSSSEIKSKGGLNPFAVIILLIAIAAGIYFSQQK